MAEYPVRIEIALGAMNLIADGTAATDFKSFGLNPEEAELLGQPKMWLNHDRPTVERLFNVLTHGVMDAIGATRFPVSVEYLAAVLSVFVHGCNTQIASEWCVRAQSNGALADGVPEFGAEMVTAGQLFALMLELRSYNNGTFIERFNRRVGIHETPKSAPVDEDPGKK